MKLMVEEKLKKMRESEGMIQRQVATELNVDTAYVSKIENGEKPVNRNHIDKLSLLFQVSTDELLTLWLADKILKVVKDEKHKQQALQLALKNIN